MRPNSSRLLLSVITTSVIVLAAGAAPTSAVNTFSVVRSTASATADSLVQKILGTTPFSGAKFNGYNTGTDLADAVLTTGFFSGGADLVGIDSGLILTADANPLNLTGPGNITGDLGSVTIAQPAAGTLKGALFSAARTALNAAVAESISTLEFTIAPTSQYLKLTYSLIITESGGFGGSGWGGDVFTYPDGIGIFVKPTGGTWDANQNCAVIPTTGTYVAMQTAGIVDGVANPQPNDVTTYKTTALANYTALVAPTLDPNYVPVQKTVVLSNPTPPNQILPPKIAYSTGGNLGIGDRFITVPLTCVVDVTGQASVDVGIAIANLNDGAVPPAMLIAGDSVGFSGNVAPVQVNNEPIVQNEVRPYEGPKSFNKVMALSGGTGVLTGEKLAEITKVLIQGKEIDFKTNSDGTLTLNIPAGLAAGLYNITTYSSYGQLILQDHLQITGNFVPKKAFGKRLSGNQVKMYYFNPTGPGTVSFRVDGREIARHSISALGIATGSPLVTEGSDKYLVRTVQLSKNRSRVLEIFVNGKRVWRGSYKAN